MCSGAAGMRPSPPWSDSQQQPGPFWGPSGSSEVNQPHTHWAILLRTPLGIQSWPFTGNTVSFESGSSSRGTAMDQLRFDPSISSSWWESGFPTVAAVEKRKESNVTHGRSGRRTHTSTALYRCVVFDHSLPGNETQFETFRKLHILFLIVQALLSKFHFSYIACIFDPESIFWAAVQSECSLVPE